MFRQLAVVAVLACAVLAAPIENFDDIPAEYKGMCPLLQPFKRMFQH